MGEGACETEADAQGAMDAITAHILLYTPTKEAPATSGELLRHCPMLALLLMSSAATALLI